MKNTTLCFFGMSLLLSAGGVYADTLTATIATPVLHQYDDAPLTPDADDPAIWRNAVNPAKSLIMASLKDTGLQVYSMQGKVLQTIYPNNHAAVSELDPPVPGLTGALDETSTCKGSRETYGRFNNVDVVYGVAIPTRGVVDLAIATDRGCDRLRIFAIDPNNASQPLTDITDSDAPRVFADRILQPSQYQPAELDAGVSSNPIDEQNTAYGLAIFKEEQRVRVFVSQRSRSRLKELLLRPTVTGMVSYRSIRDYQFPVSHTLPAADGKGVLQWEACREDANDDLQFEGLAVDHEQGVLYAAQEVVGVWKLPILQTLPHGQEIIDVTDNFLMEKVKTFGMPYAAIPNDGEYECAYGDTQGAPAGAIIVAGNAAVAGQYIEADAEGISVVEQRNGNGYVVISSQGDDTLHVFNRSNVLAPNLHLGSLNVEGVHETDGLQIVAKPFGRQFPDGLMVVHNGGAPEPEDTADINGYEYDGSTQFKFVNFKLSDIVTWAPDSLK